MDKVEAVNFQLGNFGVDETRFSFDAQEVNEVKFDLINSDPLLINEVKIDLENSEENVRKIHLTFIQSLLVFINALGEYLYRKNPKKDQWGALQVSWSYVNHSCIESKEAQDQMVKTLKNMKESQTVFFRYFMRNDAINNIG